MDSASGRRLGTIIETVVDDGPRLIEPPQGSERDSDELVEVASEAVLRMCHDLVTPAVTVRHLAEVIESDPDASPEIRRQAALIARESTEISEICAFTLGVVSGSRRVRVDRVISGCISSARTWFKGTIEEELDSATVSAHRVLLLRLVSNLLNNACRAAEPDGNVRIALTRDDTHAHLAVANTGERLDPAAVFGPDGLGEPSTLGLRIVRGIVSRYRGELRIESGVFGGTTVEVDLPLDITAGPNVAPGSGAG